MDRLPRPKSQWGHLQRIHLRLPRTSPGVYQELGQQSGRSGQRNFNLERRQTESYCFDEVTLEGSVVEILDKSPTGKKPQ